MIIIGDIASPTEKHSQILKDFFIENKEIFNNKNVICNLEGLITSNITLEEKTPILFNHPSVISALLQGNIVLSCLANNHTLDIPKYFNQTIKKLKENNIHTIGASSSLFPQGSIIELEEEGFQVFVLNYCWDFLLYHQKNPSADVYVYVIKEKEILELVKELKKNHPNCKIITYFHWSFDLENLPFPSYRLFSKALIDAGVNLVVGSHSHCVQGGEYYKDGFIIYGVGNFFIPWNTFVNGTMSYPDFSKNELAVEWEIKSNKLKLHWFENNGYNENTKIEYIDSCNGKSERFFKASPFHNLSDKEYIDYYKKNRRKKILIPVFKDYNSSFNNLKMFFLKSRARFARTLAKYKLRKWNN